MPWRNRKTADTRRAKHLEMKLGVRISNRLGLSTLVLLSALLAGCNTTSGSSRLDDTGEQLAATDDSDAPPANAAFYIQSLKGGLLARISGIKLSKSDRARGLEAEYKALETAPGGEKTIWDGSSGVHGEVIVAAPYQVGSQNCRQYSHSINTGGNAPITARGAACRNSNGSWTPLS
jgi:surface antigen